MNEEAMKSYMEQSSKRLLQLLEDHMSTPGNHKEPEKDEKKNEIDQFINQMKTLNTPPKPEPDEGGNDEDDFINLMQSINKK